VIQYRTGHASVLAKSNEINRSAIRPGVTRVVAQSLKSITLFGRFNPTEVIM
jgi:hypothetical protein